ncbi:hypothetical protein AURDEDRAFT_167645 [Auricularia subglabra TFB-10046 SS5]|nr:hypothetical protein AURDEDRAFT_167645 [Auricularia subglabra TFB-10046 SS5]
MASPHLPSLDQLGIDLDLTFGALQVGTSISMIFLGIATLQTWNYYRNFPDDPIVAKTTVVAVYLADLVHSLLLIHAVYIYTVKSSCNFAALAETVWSLDASVVIVGFIALVVQTYFCMRVLRITESRSLAACCWVLALARMAFTIALTVTIVKNGTLMVVQTHTFKWQVVCILCTGTASDIAIAASVCIGLLRRRSGFTDTDRLVDRLVAYTIGSGLVTSIVAIAEVATYLAMENFVWIAFFTIISKMFSNSLLASLNQRSAHRWGYFHGRHRSTRTTSTVVSFEKVAYTIRSDVELGSSVRTPGKDLYPL